MVFRHVNFCNPHFQCLLSKVYGIIIIQTIKITCICLNIVNRTYTDQFEGCTYIRQVMTKTKGEEKN